MKKKAIIFPLIVLAAFTASVYYAKDEPGMDILPPSTAPVAVVDNRSVDEKFTLPVENVFFVKADGSKVPFTLEVARDNYALAAGLMYREKLEAGNGMLFDFGGREQVVSFWMKDTFIPLDMIFIGADGTVKHIHANAVPQSLESVSSQVPVVAVVEINGGLAAKSGIKVGDRLLRPLPAAATP